MPVWTEKRRNNNNKKMQSCMSKGTRRTCWSISRGSSTVGICGGPKKDKAAASNAAGYEGQQLSRDENTNLSRDRFFSDGPS